MRLLSLLACLALSGSAAVGAAPSSIELVYSTESCAGEPPKPEWVAELQSRLPEFKAVWEAIGPLQKGVLLSLNASEALAQVISIDSQLPSGCYKRAWNIVNESKDTYERYIAELASAF